MNVEMFAQFGIAGIFLFFSVKAVVKLYGDMRLDSVKREEHLMAYLDKKSETDKQVCHTLDRIDRRITNLECCFGKGGDQNENNSV